MMALGAFSKQACGREEAEGEAMAPPKVIIASQRSRERTPGHRLSCPIEDIDAIVDYLIGISGANQDGGRLVALVVQHRQTSRRRRRA
jgi:hypothetical protein